MKKENEVAKAGYYSVELEIYIKVELTASGSGPPYTLPKSKKISHYLSGEEVETS